MILAFQSNFSSFLLQIHETIPVDVKLRGLLIKSGTFI